MTSPKNRGPTRDEPLGPQKKNISDSSPSNVHKPTQGKREKVRVVILGELRRVMIFRHRGRILSDDDAGRDDLALLLRVIACAPKAAEEKMLFEIEERAPWLPKDEARSLVDDLLRIDPRYDWLDGKEAGKRLNLTAEEREALRAWHLIPPGQTIEDLAAQRKARKARLRRESRRAAGVSRATFTNGNR
jgi:hypothetical protein